MAGMQAVVFHGPRDVRVEEVPRPEIEEPDDVLLRVDRAAICGTDLHPYHGRLEMEEGFVLGHEYLGTIEAKGDGVTQFEEGERAVGSFFVACGNCWFCRRGEFMKCVDDPRLRDGHGDGRPAGRAGPVRARAGGRPDAAQDSREQRGRRQPTRTCCSSATSSRPATTRSARPTCGPGDFVAVIGCGPVGLCTVMAAQALGAGTVLAVDMVPERLKLAESLGRSP